MKENTNDYNNKIKNKKYPVDNSVPSVSDQPDRAADAHAIVVRPVCPWLPPAHSLGRARLPECPGERAATRRKENK